MFSLTITVDSAEELVKLSEHVAAFDGSATTAAPETKSTPKGKSAPAKTTEKEAPAKEEKPAGKGKAKELSETEKAKLYEPVKKVALQLNKEKGRDALLRVLSGFDVEKAPDLSVEQYDDFVAAAEEELIT